MQGCIILELTVAFKVKFDVVDCSKKNQWMQLITMISLTMLMDFLMN
jgi:hypothetical protein